MNRYFVLLVLLTLAGSSWAREPAQVRVYCHSLRFEPATGGPGQVATLQFTTDTGFTEINHEVRPLRNPTLPSHGAVFLLEDPTLIDSLAGQIAFDLPPPVDVNDNGFDDFFEVSLGVATTRVEGLFTTVVDSGAVTATWSRAAGSTRGTCRLQLTGDLFGPLPEFSHTFELLEYTGTLTYVPATNAVTGVLELTQTGNPAQTLSGPFTALRVEANRFNQLTLLPMTLTNAAGQVWSALPGGLERDLIAQINYYGFLDFSDGDPTTGTPDYQEWVLSIDDENDLDGNGIPDLSDDIAALPPPSPTLTLVRSDGQLLLGISGEPGIAVDLESTASLQPSDWATAVSVTLTNSPQLVPIPIPDAQTRFWRARTR